MKMGVCYYPEFYKRDEWDNDVEEIAKIGFKVVRMAEFAWCRLEPTEGVYDFEWLDDIIERFAKKGIKTILGTPTGAPPQWIVARYPDLPVKENNGYAHPIVGGFGAYCKNHPEYRMYSKIIVEKMAEHYKDNENVILYQIDNEFMGTECFCDNCQKAFRKWAKDKYKTIENYNETLMTIFQGREMSSFDEILIPATPRQTSSPTLLMAYKKFTSDTYVDYCNIQVDAIRKFDPKVEITSNFCTLFQGFDHYKMSESFDVAACDTYPKADGDDSLRNALKLDLTRSLKKKNFWVLEQQCSPVAFREYNYTIEPLEARLYTYKSIAHGADGIVYFRWKSIHEGGERFGAGILRHDNQKGRTYHEVKAICDEINSIDHMITDSQKRTAKIAFVYSNLSGWAVDGGRKINKDVDYMSQVVAMYKYFNNSSVDVDFVISGDDISKYDMVIAPMLGVVSTQDKEWIENYTKNGGTFITSIMSGMFDENNAMSRNYYQGNLRDVLGIKVTEWATPYQNENFTFNYENNNYPATVLNMVCELEGAKEIATYNSGYYKDTPAITVNQFGKGTAYYLATGSNDQFYKEFFDKLVDFTCTSHPVIEAVDVDVKERIKDGKSLFIIMNHRNAERTINFKVDFVNAVTGEDLPASMIIAPHDVVLACVK